MTCVRDITEMMNNFVHNIILLNAWLKMLVYLILFILIFVYVPRSYLDNPFQIVEVPQTLSSATLFATILL